MEPSQKIQEISHDEQALKDLSIPSNESGNAYQA